MSATITTGQPADLAPDLAPGARLFTGLTTRENRVLLAHLNSGAADLGAVYPCLSDSWRETYDLLDDLHDAWAVSFEREHPGELLRQKAEREGYTHPDVFTVGVEEGWAETETDPAQIDWPARQAAAAIAFEVTGGRPVNPCASTAVRYGRNELGLWGENLMADALVTVTVDAQQRYLLMVERGDGYGWAVPGGAADPGESGIQAAVRELAEETGLSFPAPACQAGEPVYVPDPRASDEAWAVTVPVRMDLGRLGELPLVSGADDACRAAWIPASDYDGLAAGLAARYDGGVFAAHTGMLTAFLAVTA